MFFFGNGKNLNIQTTIITGLHLPAIVRDNTAMNGKSSSIQNGCSAQQQTVALLDGDQVRCCTLNDHKLCDHQSEMNGTNNIIQQSQQLMNQQQMMNVLKGQNNITNGGNGNGHHLASEC